MANYFISHYLYLN